MLEKHLDLCSGIGGFALALADAGRRTNRNVSTVAFCEPEQFCQQVLRKHWPEVPIYDDVKTFPKNFGKVDILTAGYPCQPFSVASSKRKGTADDRHIWPWIIEIVKQTRPSVCVFENVVGHISLGIDEVLLDLATEGYHAWPIILGAVSKNAPHRRQRVFICAFDLADTQGSGCGGGNSSERKLRERQLQSEEQGRRKVGRETEGRSEPCGENVADTGGERCKQSRTTGKMAQKGRKKEVTGRELDVFTTSGNPNVANAQSVRIQGHGASGEQEPYAHEKEELSVCGSEGSGQTQRSAISRLGGAFDGLSAWVDGDWERGVPRVTEGQKDRAKRLKALGNAIVPQVASELFTAIFEADNER